MRFERRRHGVGEAVAVDRERAARGHLVRVARRHDQRAEPAHLLVQQADRVRVGVVGPERVGADQFGQAPGLVGLGHPLRPHLVQHDGQSALRDLPGGFRTGEAAADDVNGFHGLRIL